MFYNVTECYGIFRIVREGTRMFQNIVDFPRRFIDSLEALGRFEMILESSRMF